jgi:hypothetical protein
MMLWFKKLVCYFRGHEFKAFQGCSRCTRCGKFTLSRAQLLEQLLPALNVLFKMEYDEYKKPKEKNT